jgi:hypothetical protein
VDEAVAVVGAFELVLKVLLINQIPLGRCVPKMRRRMRCVKMISSSGKRAAGARNTATSMGPPGNSAPEGALAITNNECKV